MTREQYIIRRKLNMVELGEVLGNVSEACRRLTRTLRECKGQDSKRLAGNKFV